MQPQRNAAGAVDACRAAKALRAAARPQTGPCRNPRHSSSPGSTVAWRVQKGNRALVCLAVYRRMGSTCN